MLSPENNIFKSPLYSKFIFGNQKKLHTAYLTNKQPSASFPGVQNMIKGKK